MGGSCPAWRNQNADLADASLLALLSSRGPEPPETPEPDPGWDLLIAAESGQTDKVRELLEAGVPVEILAQNTTPNAAQRSQSKVPRQEMSENELERRMRNQENTVDLGWRST